MRISNCKSCGAPIVWAKTARGKAIPLDSKPVPDGNIELVDGVAHVNSRTALLFAGELYKSHFATCPNAEEHRKP